MDIEIKNSTINDIDEIFRLYKIATDYQKTRFSVQWPEFERSLIATEITENRQWKIIMNDLMACIWATTYSDPQIWEARNEDSAVYIHRIATNPDFRGHHWVTEIVKWAKEHAKQHSKKFIRMDTVGENTKLIAHYEQCGFQFLGLSKLTDTVGLPAHYDNATVSLFQIEV